MDKRHEWILDLAIIWNTAEPGGTRDITPSAQPSPKQRPAGREGSQPSPAKALCNIPFLRDLHDVQIRKILKLCRVRAYKTREVICAVDSPSDEMYILITGELAVMTSNGTQALTINPVTTVGELGFITSCPRPVGLEAVKDSKVLRISRAQFEHLLSTDPDIQSKVYRNIIKILSDKLIGLRALVEGALAGHQKPD